LSREISARQNSETQGRAYDSDRKRKNSLHRLSNSDRAK
jgi:hypothetical protein